LETYNSAPDLLRENSSGSEPRIAFRQFLLCDIDHANAIADLSARQSRRRRRLSPSGRLDYLCIQLRRRRDGVPLMVRRQSCRGAYLDPARPLADRNRCNNLEIAAIDDRDIADFSLVTKIW